MRDAPLCLHRSGIQQNGPIAKRLNGLETVADEQDGAVLVDGNRLHLAQRLFLKACIAYRKDLINDQDLRLQMRRHSERQPDIHAAAVALHRRVEKSFDFGEVNDLVEFLPDLRPGHPEDRSVQKDVLATGQFRVKAGADLQQACDTAAYDRPSTIRLSDAAEYLEQRRFAGSVPPDNSEHLAALHLEAHVAQGPELLNFIALNDLPTTNEIKPLAGKISHLTRDDVTQAQCSARADLPGGQ